MHPDVEKLLELARVDAEIARLNDEIAQLPKRVAVIEEKMNEARAGVEEAQAAIKNNEGLRRKQEAEIAALQQKISKYREQSLSVKTNDQYKALMHEVQFAEQEIRACEDKILESMEATEGHERKLKEAQAEFKKDSAIIETEKADAKAKTAEDEALLTKFRTERDGIRTGVSADVVLHYDRVFKFRGSAVAEARDQRCGGCNVLLRPQVFGDIRSGQLIVCESCQRYLFYDPEHAGTNGATEKKVTKGNRERAWHFLPEENEFAAFVNAKGGCSMRLYDAATGSVIDFRRAHGADYQVAFKAHLRHAPYLIEAIEGQDLEAWSEQIPPDALAELQRLIPQVEPTSAGGATDTQ